MVGQLKIAASTNKDKKSFLGTEENGLILNEKWNVLNHTIRFLIAVRQGRSEDALNEAKEILREEEIFN